MARPRTNQGSIAMMKCSAPMLKNLSKPAASNLEANRQKL